MTSNGAASFEVSLLKGNTYDNWCIKMKAHFRAHDVWDVVQTVYKKSEDKDSLTQT